jgi:hypothetical protein
MIATATLLEPGTLQRMVSSPPTLRAGQWEKKQFSFRFSLGAEVSVQVIGNQQSEVPVSEEATVDCG